jgi:hypothetical protein
MKKVILSALVTAVAATAQAAGPISGASKAGASNSSTGVANSSKTTVTLVSGASADASVTASDATLWVIQNPSAASEKSAQSASTSTEYVLTASGNLLEASVTDISNFAKDPSATETYSASVTLVSNGVEYLVTTSGTAVNSSGAFLKDNYGQDTKLVVNGSGTVFRAGSDAIVLAKDSTGNFISTTATASGASLTVSAAEVELLSAGSSTASGNVSEAAAAPFKRNKK